jgi:hypothetical protein
MWIEELWPSTKELVGLQFEDADDFRACWLLAMEHPEAFRWTSWDDLTVEVRKTHKHLVDRLGVTYTEFELVDLDDLPAEERQRLQREAVQYGMKVLLERLRRENCGE